MQWMEVGDVKKKVKLITRAMKPLEEECNHIISLTKESGLQTSTSGFFNYEADLDAVLAIAGEDDLNCQNFLATCRLFCKNSSELISNRIQL